MERYYDKLLHIFITFAVMLVLLEKVRLSVFPAVLVTLLLQTIKTAYNFATANRYRALSDWIANVAGYACVFLYIGF